MPHTSITANVTRVLVVTLALAVIGLGAEPGGQRAIREDVSTADLRITTRLSRGWQFVQDDSLTAASALAAAGAGWTAVTLPHSWNAADAASTTASVPYARGRGWYRLEFSRPTTGVRHWLQFDGASIVADVWLNGKKLGQHRGAFTAFRFDVTDALVAGKNVLLVGVDNREPKTDTDVTAIAPLGGDFNMAGGLYRGVSLVSTSGAAHVALGDLAGPGVYVRTTALVKGTATISVLAKIANDSARDGEYVVRATLLDAQSHPAVRVQRNASIKAGATAGVVQEMIVAGSHLWQGTADPYLYTLTVDLLDSHGVALDRVVQPFGIRQMTFDPDRGFFLNGVPTPLHGVSMHQDYLGKAWAISERDTDESLGLVLELGANTIRLAHYPHSQYTYTQADKLGLVVWAEVPFVNGSAVGCSQNDPTDLFRDNLKQQLQELIRQQYNHASIGMWSIGNETTMSQTIGCGATPGKDNVTPLLRELHRLAKAEDEGRATTLADLNEGTSFLAAPISTGGISDIWALNRYVMWYYGGNSPDSLARNLDEMHAKYPSQPVGVSEYGAGAALSDQTDNPLGGPVGSFNMGVPRVYQPEGYASFVHEQNYGVFVAREYVWGTYVWNMFDFGSGIRNEGDVRGTNTKGLVTFDRKTRKDPFFFYKANWSRTPVTYIAGRRYINRAYAVTDITVYSNADSVRVSINGRTIGTKPREQCPMKTCVFKDVSLAAGANTIVAEGSHAGKTVSDRVDWTLANARDVNIAAGQLATGFKSSGGALYGSDNFFKGGTGATLTGVGLRSPVDSTPVSGITEATDKQLYAAYRSGTFRYDIPLAAGSYRVTLGFLEPSRTSEVGDRIFGVAVNGVSQIADLDVLRVAGAYRTAVTRTFPVTVAKGPLVLDFIPTVGEAVVSNITITRIDGR